MIPLFQKIKKFIVSPLVLALVLNSIFFTSFPLPKAKAASVTYSSNTVLPDGNCSGGVCTYDNLTINNGVTVTVPSTITSIVVNGNADIQGALSANGQGSAAAAGTGVGGNGSNGSNNSGAGGGGGAYGGGGGAGGRGWDGGSSTGGTAHGSGSNTAPVTVGSGGGTGSRSAANGGAGGGVINLTVSGTLTVGGSISANGATAVNTSGHAAGGGGGSGGAINIDTNILSGSGSITTNGGNGGSATGDGGGGGGGGGGRIAIRYDSQSAWSITPAVSAGSGGTVANGSAVAGSSGVAGTIILFNQNGTAVDMTDDDVTIYSAFEFLSSTFPATGTTYDSLTITSASRLTNTSGAITFTLNGSFTTTGSGNSLTGSQAFTIDAAGNVTFVNFNISNTAAVTITADGDFSVDSGSILSVAGGGSAAGAGSCPGGNGSNGSNNSGGGGGGGCHGGAGGAGGKSWDNGNGGSAGTSTYGTNSNPTTAGSGGGTGGRSGQAGGAGGGIITVTVAGTLDIDGTISANGSTASAAAGNTAPGGGGSGGSIKITGGTTTGDGNIAAGGGAGGAAVSGGGGGGGGGGRIYIGYAGSLPARFNSVSAAGISVSGGNGGAETGSGNIGNAGSTGTYYSEQLNTAPTVAITSVSQTTDSTKYVTINYTATDADGNNVSLATYEYSADNSSWATMTEKAGVGSDGTSSLAASSGGTTHDFMWDVGTDLANIEDGAVYVRLKLNDGTVDSSTVTSDPFAIDTLSPTVATGADIGSRPDAGDTNVLIDAAFTEGNPNTNDFYLAINGGGYGSASVGEANTADPNARSTATETTLDGSDCITKVKVVHTDDFGNTVTSENLNPSTKCVKPYQPDAPTVDSPTNNSVDITIDENDSEAVGLEYAIHETTTDQYVQTDGSLDATADWNNSATWGTTTVTGLTSPVSDYSFEVKSRNSQDNSVESIMSASANITNTTPTITLISTTQNTVGQYVDIEYTLGDPQSDTQELVTYEYSTDDGGTWNTMTEKAGVGSDGTTGLSSSVAGTTHNFMWDYATDTSEALAIIRLQANDGVDDGNTDISDPFTLNSPPTSTVPTASFATDASGQVTISFEIDDTDANDSNIKIEYSTDDGDTWNDPTLDEFDGSTTATYDTPQVENDNEYQIGNADGWITTDSGANTVSVKWLSQADLPSETYTEVKVRVTPNDQAIDGTAQESATFIIDNEAPAGLDNFINTEASGTNSPFTWTAASDDYFNHYEIWYGTDGNDVDSRTGAAVEWDQADNSNLTLSATESAIITGFEYATSYYATIWAIDDYGNESFDSTTFYFPQTLFGGMSVGHTTRQVQNSETGENEAQTNELPADLSVETYEDLQNVTVSDWRYEVIDKVISSRLFTGERDENGDLVFNANHTMNRAMAAEVVARYVGCSKSTPASDPFEDVSSNDWFAPAVACLKNKGIVAGKTSERFVPGDSITRAEFLKFLIEGHMHINPTLLTVWRGIMDANEKYFEDVNENNWYAKYVNLAYSKGLIEGYIADGQRYSGANSAIIRLEAAAMTSNFLDL